MKINKVVLIGTGTVGATYAYALLNQAITDELILIDVDSEKAKAEAMDLNDGMYYADHPTQIRHGDFNDCKDADIICITAGVSQTKNATRLDFAEKNTEIFKSIIDNVMQTGFDGIFVIASNPVDIMTYVTWKFSGLPKGRIIGTGTMLDTSRYCHLIGEYFDVNVKDVNGYVIGEHGDSQVACLSSTTIGSRPILEKLDTNDDMKQKDFKDITDRVRDAAPSIISRKGATFYGIGIGLAKLTRAILRDENAILPVSAYLNGEYGHNDLYIGVPSVIGRKGILQVIDIELDNAEKVKLDKSVQIIKENLNMLKLQND
ncbi:L-lactate dehydrogenase [Lentibacillus lipolyticus]|nr:L-lactate dehydrogenase [Lentibacillus lipolyticus]